jgi:hypothetical protein
VNSTLTSLDVGCECDCDCTTRVVSLTLCTAMACVVLCIELRASSWVIVILCESRERHRRGWLRVVERCTACELDTDVAECPT